MIAKCCALSTIDNPYNPFEDYANWFVFDTEKGYNSSAYLARIAKLDDQMSVDEAEIEIERAIDEIVELNPLGIYIKIVA